MKSGLIYWMARHGRPGTDGSHARGKRLNPRIDKAVDDGQRKEEWEGYAETSKIPGIEAFPVPAEETNDTIAITPAGDSSYNQNWSYPSRRYRAGFFFRCALFLQGAVSNAVRTKI